MIISRSCGFVFTTMPKVGSTSLNCILSQFTSGENDIGSGWEEDPEDAIFGSSQVKEYAGKNYPKLSFNEYTRILQRPIPWWPKDVNDDLSKLDNPLLVNWVKKVPNQEMILNYLAVALVRHLTPTEIVNLGLIKDEEVSSFEWYTVVREPFDRFLSAHFYDANIHKFPNTLEFLIQTIDEMDPERRYLLYSNKITQDYVEYNGKQISNVIKHSDFQKQISEFVDKYNGTMPDVPRFKSYSRPEWSKRPIEEFLPQRSIDKLNIILKDDIKHYSEL